MNVIPAIDIKGGKCVQLVGGRPGTEKVTIDNYMGVALKWQADGAEMIHLIDLDSALGTGHNEHAIEKIAGGLSIPVQVGGGIRTSQQVQRMFDLGCERVIVGTRAIQDLRFAEEIAKEYPDGIVVAADATANEVVIKGWQEGSGKSLEQVVRSLESLPVFGILYTNVEVEGRLEGIDPGPVKELLAMTRKPLIVSGGITTMGDLDTLQRMGVHSVVLGMSIYTGKIDFRHAVRVFR